MRRDTYIQPAMESFASLIIHCLYDDSCIWVHAHEAAVALGVLDIQRQFSYMSPTYFSTKTYATQSGNERATFLSEKGLHNLIFRTKTPISETFQNWILDEFMNIRQNKIEQIELNAKNMQMADIKIKHDVMVDVFKGEQMVYFGLMSMLHDDKYIVHIGSTPSLHKEDYKNLHIFTLFPCDMAESFLTFLKNHPIIKQYMNADGSMMMTQAEIDKVIGIVHIHVHKFCKPLEPLTEDEEHQPSTPLPSYTERRYRQGRGQKVQRYTEDGKTLLSTYEGLITACRDPCLHSPTPSQIKQAIKANHVYKGFRWAFLDRELPDTTVQDIGDTVQSQTIKKGFVAMLDLKKSKIVSVFCDQKEAGQDRGFRSCAPVSKAIQKGTQSGGHYFMMWHDCDEALQAEYLKHNSLPTKRHQQRMLAVNQINPNTQDIIKQYACVADVIKEWKVSRTSLKDAIENKYLLKGFYWTNA